MNENILLPLYIEPWTKFANSFSIRPFKHIKSSTNQFKFSFCPRTIPDWNNLTSDQVNGYTPQTFKLR